MEAKLTLQIKNIYKSFKNETTVTKVLEDITFSTNQGEFVSILGQSGCGKSTLLRIIGGFEKPDNGAIYKNEAKIAKPSKDIMMIFQDEHQLFPWKTLKENIIYAIKKTATNYDRSIASEKTSYSLNETGLDDFADHYPGQLSGGMKQRAALARALALDSSVLLMDEPFSSLDYFNRKNSQEFLLKFWEKNKTTILFVTHDIDEALMLSQKIVILNKHSHKINSILSLGSDAQVSKEYLEKLIL